MTWCEAQFRRFTESIKLDPTRRARIDSAISNLKAFCDNDKELAVAKGGDIFLQGSVSTGSVVKPLAGDEFDVDLIFPFGLASFDRGIRPGEIMRWFESRFSRSDFYRPRLIEKDRCVRIDYAHDFHLDITPATTDVESHWPWAIAIREAHSWERTDPSGFADWVHAIDARAGGTDGDNKGRFVRSIRYLKRWRDHFFSEETAPTSIVLVTSLGNHDPTQKNYNPPLDNLLYPEYQTDAAYLYDMLRLTHSCIIAGRQTAFLHPTLRNDLAGDWAHTHLNDFLGKLSNCISHLESAIYDKSDQSSVRHYKAAFGDTFPN